jgi:heme-degrading monooxygenase HmoA
VSSGFVAISTFKVANGMEDEVRRAFVERPHLVDTVPGFIRMDVLNPSGDPAEFWLLTYWTDEASFSAWHGSDEHRESHAGIPRGLKLDAAFTQVRTFAHIAS